MSTPKIDHNHSIDTRVALLEQSINNINDTMVRFERRFDKIDEKFDRIDEKFDRIDDRITSQFRWTLGIMITLYTSGFGVLLTFVLKSVH